MDEKYKVEIPEDPKRVINCSKCSQAVTVQGQDLESITDYICAKCRLGDRFGGKPEVEEKQAA